MSASVLPRPVLVIAPAIPTEVAGTSIILRRLFENFTADEIVLLGPSPDRRAALQSRAFHYPVHWIPSLPRDLRGERYWRIASVPAGVLTALRAVRRYRPAAILAMFPYETSLLTGYLLHQLTGLPLVAYLCDLYMEDRRSAWETRLARWLQPRVFRAASRIVVLNEGMRAYYKERYGQDSLCVPTCINVTVPAPGVPPRSGNPFVIGYSGNVNSARTGQLRALVRAIGSDAAFAIRYFTPQTPDFLRSQGLWTENSSHLFVTDEGDLVRHLSGCDALFLPLAFDVDQSSRDQLATCFGTKSFEYFLSQRPVIVQCPGDYFTARFFRAGDCGLVVDDPSAEALAAALRRLSSDESLRTRLVQNALEAARQFEGPRVAGLLRSELMRIIGRETRT